MHYLNTDNNVCIQDMTASLKSGTCRSR